MTDAARLRRPKPARMGRHDEEAVPIVVALMEASGFECHSFGAELESQGLREVLLGLVDATSLLLRFRPDRAFIKPGVRSVLCEIKSEAGKYPNFALEVDSYQAARAWNATGKHVCYAFVDLRQQAAVGCWAQEIPPPKLIRVPDRNWDFERNWKRMEREFPEAELVHAVYLPSTGMSGTPFFTLPKAARFLMPLAQFIDEQLSRLPMDVPVAFRH